MRVIGVMLMVGLTLGASACADRGESEGPIFPFDYRLVELDSGFKAYLIRAGAPGQIAYVSMVRTGAREEVEEGRTGYAHFFEHMMFRGTEKYPDYDGVTESIGASRNAFTSNDYTVYYLVASNEYLEQIADLESDRFRNLAYSEADFRTEAGAILGEYQQGAMSPGSYLDRHLRLTAWDRHTYRHQTIGFEEDVRAMPEGYEYSLSFYDRFYRPENVVLVLAGDFDVDDAERMVREHYGGWEPGYVPPAVEEEPEQEAPRELLLEYPGRTLPVIDMDFKGPAWSATNRIAVATEVLGRVAFGSNSNLYRKLVIQEGRVQNLAGGFDLQRDPTLLSIATMVNDTADVDAVKREIGRTVLHFKNELVDETLLANAKSNMKYEFLMGLETGQQVAFSMMPFVINTGGIEAVEEYFRTLESVTGEDVRTAAQRYLQENRSTTVTMVQAEGRS